MPPALVAMLPPTVAVPRAPISTPNIRPAASAASCTFCNGAGRAGAAAMDDQLLADTATQAQDFGDLGGVARTQDEFGPTSALAGEVVAIARIDGIAGDHGGGVEPRPKLGKKLIDLLCHGA